MTSSALSKNVGKEMKIHSFFFFFFLLQLSCLQKPSWLQTLSMQSHTSVFWVTGFANIYWKRKTCKKKREKKISSTTDPLSSDLSSVPFLSNSQFTARSIKLSSTVQHKASCCLCSDAHFTWCCLQMPKKYIPSVTRFAQFRKERFQT